METRERRVLRGLGVAATPAAIPLPAEAPAEAPAIAAAPVTASAESPQPPAEEQISGEIARLGQEAVAALADSQAAMVRAAGAFGEEMAGLTRSGVDLAARTATEMLEVKTVCDVLGVNTRFVRKSIDSLLDGSAKLSGLGVSLAAESSRSLLAQWGRGWIEVARLAP